MPIVYIPAALRKYSNDVRKLEVAATTIREVVDQLEANFPGIKDRLLEKEQLRPGIAVAIDSRISSHGMVEKVAPESEVHFVPSVSGG
ncbi:MAG: hypothetical protein HON04_11480 [Planctomicrobium sp.]|jgi:sulfur-carrier protein|nr:hypothetical protein [Planctomicrobium sp.]